MEELPKLKEIYRHFKGGRYQVETLAFFWDKKFDKDEVYNGIKYKKGEEVKRFTKI